MNLITQKINNPQLINPIRGFNAERYFNRLVPGLIIIGFLVCAFAFFLMLIFGGVQWITSNGDKQSLENARNKLVNGLTGLFILFILFIIVLFLNQLFGINLGNAGTP